jgi:beta-xylosidase
LSKEQLAGLNALTGDLPGAISNLEADSDGTLQVDIPMQSNDIVLVTLQRK